MYVHCAVYTIHICFMYVVCIVYGQIQNTKVTGELYHLAKTIHSIYTKSPYLYINRNLLKYMKDILCTTKCTFRITWIVFARWYYSPVTFVFWIWPYTIHYTYYVHKSYTEQERSSFFDTLNKISNILFSLLLSLSPLYF